MQDLENRGVFGNPVHRKPDDICIGLLWAYAVKRDKEGKYLRVRARLALMGNEEKRTDLLQKLEAYAPVAQVATTRILISLHLHDRSVMFRKFDVCNAYINEFMRRTVLCRMPADYTALMGSNGTARFVKLKDQDKPQTDKCLPLRMNLYGGMEAGRVFWEAWVDWHLTAGFILIPEERCYLQKRGPEGAFVKLAYHVDDNTVAYTEGQSSMRHIWKTSKSNSK